MTVKTGSSGGYPVAMKKMVSVLLITASTALAVPAQASPKPTADEKKQTSVTLYPLYFRQISETEAEGGHTTMTITLTKNTKKPLQVSISEDAVGGTGDQWRAAAWSAATTSILTVGADFTGYKFEVEAKGRIDGPSAGALMTVGMIALLRGDKLKKSVAMTGTINPDGTIGPVGGISNKLDGVKQLKAKRFIVPIGQSIDTDLEGNEVDVKALAKKSGITVGEVPTIQTAYLVFTGKRLPEPAAPSNEVQYSKAAKKQFEEVLAQLETNSSRSCSDFQTTIGTIGGPLVDLTTSAGEYQQIADAALADGAISIAYTNYFRAEAICDAGIALAQSSADLSSGAITLDQYLADVQADIDEAESALEDFNSFLGGVEPGDLQEGIALQVGVGSLISIRAEVDVAMNEIASIKDAIAAGEDPSSYQASAIKQRLRVKIVPLTVSATQGLVNETAQLPGGKFDRSAKVARIANFVEQFGDAELAAFESLVIGEGAPESDLSANDIRNQLSLYNNEYVAASYAQDLMAQSEEGDQPASVRAWWKLGAALALSRAANRLLSEGYSYGAVYNDSGKVESIDNQPALDASLERGNTLLRSAIALTSKHKTDPFRFVGALQLAESLYEEETAESQLEAASTYLNSFLLARSIAYLGGYHKDGYSGSSSSK